MPDNRSVQLERMSKARYRATNVRGGTLTLGEGEDTDFTPVELLLVALGGCTAIDVDYITGKRAEPSSFTVDVSGEKIRDEQGNRLTGLSITLHVTFPEGAEGDAAREVLPGAAAKSHDRLCTVGRTVEVGTPIATHVDG
jgi:uncharacterized OsmC-like protein